MDENPYKSPEQGDAGEISPTPPPPQWLLTIAGGLFGVTVGMLLLKFSLRPDQLEYLHAAEIGGVTLLLALAVGFTWLWQMLRHKPSK